MPQNHKLQHTSIGISPRAPKAEWISSTHFPLVSASSTVHLFTFFFWIVHLFTFRLGIAEKTIGAICWMFFPSSQLSLAIMYHLSWSYSLFLLLILLLFSIQDNGGGMSPESLRHCMSFGFSQKCTTASIGRCNDFRKWFLLLVPFLCITFTDLHSRMYRWKWLQN